MKNALKLEVDNFLSCFKEKLKIYGVVFHRSDKNSQTLLDLDITEIQRKNFLFDLKTEDYYKGPANDLYDPHGSPVWEFGMKIKGHEIYIKVSIGYSNKPVICKSFHFAEREIKHPYTKETDHNN